MLGHHQKEEEVEENEENIPIFWQRSKRKISNSPSTPQSDPKGKKIAVSPMKTKRKIAEPPVGEATKEKRKLLLAATSAARRQSYAS